MKLRLLLEKVIEYQEYIEFIKSGKKIGFFGKGDYNNNRLWRGYREKDCEVVIMKEGHSV